MTLSTDDVKVADELSRLIQDGSSIVANDRAGISCFQTSAENILNIRFGTNSAYYRRFMESYKIGNPILEQPSDVTKKKNVQIGILQSALNDLNKGLLKDLFYERELVVFSDILKQAFEFLNNQKTYAAAGVYGRIVLETTIREYAKLKLRENYNPEMKFDQIISKLKDGEFILQTFENSLRNNYKIGSEAAHYSDEFQKYSKKILEGFLTFIRDNVLILK